nr:uncharacterized protein DKFZp434B061-like [Penaeus vannamei]
MRDVSSRRQPRDAAETPQLTPPLTHRTRDRLTGPAASPSAAAPTGPVSSASRRVLEALDEKLPSGTLGYPRLSCLTVAPATGLPTRSRSVPSEPPTLPDCAPPPGCSSPDASEGKRPSESPRRRVESSDSPRPQLVPGRQPLAMSRSTVRHHPLVAEDSPLPGPSPAESPLGGSPLRGMSPDRLLNDLDMRSFRAPDDPSLNLLEVPSTNWTRSPRESGSSSLASSTCDLNAPIYDPDRNSKMLPKSQQYYATCDKCYEYHL